MMTYQVFRQRVAELSGQPVKGVGPALEAAKEYIAEHWPAELPLHPNFANLAAVLERHAESPAVPTPAQRRPQASASGRIEGAVPSTPGTISTSEVIALAQGVLGKLPNTVMNLPEPQRREAALAALWIAHLDGELPESLQSECARFSSKYWRPSPEGVERAACSMRQASLAKLVSKAGL